MDAGMNGLSTGWLGVAVLVAWTTATEWGHGQEATTEAAPLPPAGPTPPPPAAAPGPTTASAPTAEAAPEPEAPPPPGVTAPEDVPSYSEPPPAGGAGSTRAVVPPAGGIYEPPPPGFGPVYEPPPPPEPEHVAPRTAFWAGARVGWWMPFGSLWGRCQAYDAFGCLRFASVPLRDFVGSGPAVEGNVGARLGRAYNVYLAWEHARLGRGRADFALLNEEGTETEMPSSARAWSDLFGLGVRFSSDPDHLGLLADLLVGFRTLTVEWEAENLPAGAPERMVMNHAPLEFRFGLGADVRLSELLSLSPMVHIGSGVFRSIEWELPDGHRRDAVAPDEGLVAHGWFSFSLGGHFDLAGAR